MRDDSDQAVSRGPRRYLLPLLIAILALALFSACSEAEGPAPQTVELDPEQAAKSGDARHKCWSGRCWWVVWCGHNICDGSWQWTFPATGNYEIIWKGLNFKCAGAPPYELRINGDVVKSGLVDQYKSCEQCQRGSMAEVFRDTSLGEYSLEAGDEIMLYATNDFACGIDGPGAYAAHDSVTAELRD